MVKKIKSTKFSILFIYLVCLQALIIILYYFASLIFYRRSSSLLWKAYSDNGNSFGTKPFQVESCATENLHTTVTRNNTIYGITPTHSRLTQKAVLTRLLQTLLNVPNFHWIVVEDSDKKTPLVAKLLKESSLSYTHLSRKTKRPSREKRGIDQINLALTWIRGCIPRNESGVVYFMDDDNTYSLKVFDEMRKTKVASCWLVGFAGGLKFEGPGKCENGTVLSWYTAWKQKRKFAIDMAAFAVNLSLILNNIRSSFSWKWPVGTLETRFLESLNLSMSDMEGKANCTEVLAWRTKTVNPTIVRIPWLQRFRNMYSYKNDIEV